jgi:hypothetical protein
MNLSAQEITSQLLMLPEQVQREALDFIEFLQYKSKRELSAINKHKSGVTVSKDMPDIQATTDEQTVSPIYLAFEQAGLIGCIETDEQLSTTYKEKLDFSFKHDVAG